VNIFSARPGIIIGRKGAEVDKLGAELRAVYGQDIHINIQEIQRPEIEAQLIAESIASQLVRRITFRRAMRRAMENALRFGAQGVKIRCSGRLNGAEIARSEWYQEGRLPLHTLKADIEYGFAEAFTTYGAIGVKVWIYKGELHRSKAHRRVL
jgi:small subunit ribosomal protein S3